MIWPFKKYEDVEIPDYTPTFDNILIEQFDNPVEEDTEISEIAACSGNMNFNINNVLDQASWGE